MNRRPIIPFVLSALTAIATLVLVGVGFALLAPGSPLESIWLLYPARDRCLAPYKVLAELGAGAGGGLAAACRLLRRRRWGWVLAVVIFTVNGAGDVMQLVTGHPVEGGVGVAVAGAVLVYLFRPRIRAAFA